MSTNPQNPQSESVPGAAALSKAITLLRTIGNHPQPLRFTELQQHTGFPKGTLHRMLNALTTERLIRHDEATQTYTLGIQMLEWAHHVWDNQDLKSAAHTELEMLSQHTCETVYLALYEDPVVVFIDKRESQHPVRMYGSIGKRASMHASAVGKAILAFLPPEKQQEILQLPLESYTPSTITSAEQLLSHLQNARKQGFFTNLEEHEAGIHTVAAPIFNVQQQPIGALAISAPNFRMPEANFPELGQKVHEAAQNVTQKVGGRPPMGWKS